MQSINKFLFVFLAGAVLLCTANAGRAIEVKNVKGQFRTEETELEEGDEVPVDLEFYDASEETSSVDLKVTPDQTVRVKNGRFTITGTGPTIQIKLDSGIIVHGGETDGEVKDFEVTTPNAISGVRGTKFFIRAKPDDTYICVCEGVVWTRKKGFYHWLTSNTVDVPAGYDLHVRSGDPLGTPVRAPDMVDMVWEMLEDLGHGQDSQTK